MVSPGGEKETDFPKPPQSDADWNELTTEQYLAYGDQIMEAKAQEQAGPFERVGGRSHESAPEPIEIQLIREIEYGSSLEEAIGCLSLHPRYPTIYDIHNDDITLTQAMENSDAFRLFLFGLAVLYYNMWLATNSLKATVENEPVKDDQGRYQITAHRFMMSLFNDFGTVPIGEVNDLSEKSEMVRAVFEDAGR